MIDCLCPEDPDDFRLEELLGQVVGVGIESEYRRQISPGRSQHLEPIRLGLCMRMLVRIDSPLAKTLESNVGHDSPTKITLTQPLELLMINVNGRIRLRLQYLLTLPIANRSTRAVVIRFRTVRGLAPRKLQLHKVVSRHAIKLVLQRRVDHIVRRSNALGERAHAR